MGVADLHGFQNFQLNDKIQTSDLFYLDQETEPKISRPEVRVALNLAYQNSKGEVIDKDIKADKVEEHYYDSVRFQRNITPTN